MDIVRSWKDPEYRAEFPGVAHPAGPADLTRISLDDAFDVAGGATEHGFSFGCCHSVKTWTMTLPAFCAISLNYC